MNLRRQAKLANLVVAAVLMLGVWLLLVYTGSRPALRTLIDLTPQQVNSVDRATVELLGEIGDRGIEVEFHLFFPRVPGRGATPALEQARVIHDRLQQATRMLVRRYQWLASESVTVVDHPLNRVSADTKAAVDAFDYKGGDSVVVVAVRQEGQERRFRKLSIWHDLAEIRRPEGPGVGEDPPPVLKRYLGEVGLSSAMKSLLVQGSPVAYLLKGFDQGRVNFTNPTIGTDYGTFVTQLAAHGFRIAELDLRRAREVPRDAALVILLEPKLELPEFEAGALMHYVRGGGRLFVNYSWSPIGADRNPTGGKLGELLGYEVGLRPIFHLINDHGRAGGRGLDGNPAVRKLQLTLNGQHPVTRLIASSGQPMEVAEARELQARASPPEGVTIQPLLWTDRGGWLARPGTGGGFDYTAPRVGLRQFQVGLAIEVAPPGDAEGGEGEKEAPPTESGRSGQVVVISGLFCNNSGFRAFGDLALNICNWMAERRVLMNIQSHRYQPAQMKVQPQQLDRARIFLIWGVPGALLALGLLVVFVRRRI